MGIRKLAEVCSSIDSKFKLKNTRIENFYSELSAEVQNYVDVCGSVVIVNTRCEEQSDFSAEFNLKFLTMEKKAC